MPFSRHPATRVDEKNVAEFQRNGEGHVTVDESSHITNLRLVDAVETHRGPQADLSIVFAERGLNLPPVVEGEVGVNKAHRPRRGFDLDRQRKCTKSFADADLLSLRKIQQPIASVVREARNCSGGAKGRGRTP